MAANPVQLSGLARRLVDDKLLEEHVARDASEEASKDPRTFRYAPCAEQPRRLQ